MAFDSAASNLVSGDTNGVNDVFVRDRMNGKTSRVSVSSSGTQGNGLTNNPSISADGRYVAFTSSASNLVPSDTNELSDVFVHDRTTGKTSRVSVSSSGVQADQFGGSPSISADGRYVAFLSAASNLVVADTNGISDVFVHDRTTGKTSRVSVSSSGVQASNAEGGPGSPSISADGRYVAFTSSASNLVSGDTNDVRDVFVHDRMTAKTTRVSVGSSGVQGNDSSSVTPAISGNGRYVVFESDATNLVAGDTNGKRDVFTHDRTTGKTVRVSVSSTGVQVNDNASSNPANLSTRPSISSDGRYVAFGSWASGLVDGDSNGHKDVFVRDTFAGTTTRISVSSNGVEGNHVSTSPAMSADGRYVVFRSYASNFISGDTDDTSDVFIHERAAMGRDPVPVVSGNVRTGKPILVLIGGLFSNTGLFSSKDDGAGAPWGYLGSRSRQGELRSILGVEKTMVADTWSDARSLSASAYKTTTVIDSQGSLDRNIDALVRWLRMKDRAGEFGNSPVILVGHSYGGVIARSMLASGTSRGFGPKDPTRQRIAGVIQFGSPNGGSRIAEAVNGGYGAEGALGRAFSGKKSSDATRQLAENTMRRWNQANKGPVGVPIVRLGGLFLPYVLDSQLSHGDRIQLQAIHKAMGKKSSDGAVSSDSLLSANNVLLDPKRDFGNGAGVSPFLGLAHAGDLPGAIVQVVPQNSQGKLLGLLAGHIRKMKASVQPGTAFSAARALRTHTTLAADLQDGVELPPRTLAVPAGSTSTVAVPIDAPVLLVLSSSNGTPTVDIRDKTGTRLPLVIDSFPDAEASTVMAQVSPITVGEHVVEVALQDGGGGDVKVVGIFDGGAILQLAASDPRENLGISTLTAKFSTSAGAPILGSIVSSTVSQGEVPIGVLTLRDDGLGADSQPLDGVYSAAFSAPVPGRYTAAVSAMHPTAERGGAIVFDVGSPLASVAGPLEEVLSEGPGHTHYSYGLRVPLSVSEEGTYTVSATLADAAGREVGMLSERAYLESGESTALVATIDASALSGIAAGKLVTSPLRITRDADGVELDAGVGPSYISPRNYSTADFHAFSVSVAGPAADPSPTERLSFTGRALNTSSSVESVDYSLDGGGTWAPAVAEDGAFDSSDEDFVIEVDLSDNAYGLLVRQEGSDGTTLPVEDWAGVRFTVDTVDPNSVAELATIVDTSTIPPVLRASWLPSDAPSDTTAAVRYRVEIDGSEMASTYDEMVEIPVPAEGPHTLRVTPQDEAGNTGPASHVSFEVSQNPDHDAPSTNLLLNPDPNTRGWHKSSVIASLEATDGVVGSGVSGTRYAVGEGDGSLYSAPFTMVGDGVRALAYSSVDFAGNREATQTVAIRVDTTPPITRVNAGSVHVAPASISLHADDVLSGVARTEYRLDGGPWKLGNSLQVADVGSHRLEFRSTDVAGNTETAKLVSFAIVQRATVLALLSKSSSSLGYGIVFKISGALTTEGKPVAGRQVTLQSTAPGGAFKDTAFKTTTNSEGVFTFSVKPTAKTFYKVRFSGDSVHKASSSGPVYATPKVSLGTPVAPKTIKRSNSYTVYGSLKPPHKAGTKSVRIYKYKQVGKKWVRKGYVTAKAYNYKGSTRYQTKIKLTSKGTWRLRAYAPADSLHAATWSSKFDTVKVK